MPQALTGGHAYRSRVARTLLLVDLRRYRKHRGDFLCADRVLVAGRWTPLVRVRVRQLRAADGATEL